MITVLLATFTRVPTVGNSHQRGYPSGSHHDRYIRRIARAFINALEAADGKIMKAIRKAPVTFGYMELCQIRARKGQYVRL